MADHDPNPPRLTDDERFRLKLKATALADALQCGAQQLPAPTWRDWAARQLSRALEKELRRDPPKR
jgi:hypothetical protein